MSTLPFSELPVPLLQENCLATLQLESTLQHLFLYDFSVEASAVGQLVMDRLEANPLMPGAILIEQGQLLGMISRRKFLEHLSRPYGLELFLKRPLTSLYRFVAGEILVLSSQTSIVEATRQSLARAPEQLCEPIVVEVDSQSYRLLDVHQLLVAQLQIHKLATQLLNQVYWDLNRANQELQCKASLDGLTQLANRRRFDEYLHEAWGRMAQQQAPITLIMVDVDCFKLFNDTYGHLAGDECLKRVALSLKEAVNSSPHINSRSSLVARYGGEEFAIVLPQTDLILAEEVAEKIQDRVKQLQIPHQTSSLSGFLTLSLGVASTIPQRNLESHRFHSPEELIALADRALYQAKTLGRDRVHYADL